MPVPPSTALSAVELVKTYQRGRGAPPVRALDGLSFEVAAGSVFALLGPNGAGKSTTVKVLTTLSRPTSGTATVAGIDVLREPDAVRRTIGLGVRARLPFRAFTVPGPAGSRIVRVVVDVAHLW
jgi:ABC-2 type transport system ATP-binding protein